MDAESTSAKASLFKLPAELRNRIYELVLLKAKPIRVPLRERVLQNFLSDFRYIEVLPRALLFEPGLLRVNHQAYAEATPVFYGGNTFHVHSLDSTAH